MASLNNTLEYILKMAEEPEVFCKECELKYNSKIQKSQRKLLKTKRKLSLCLRDQAQRVKLQPQRS